MLHPSWSRLTVVAGRDPAALDAAIEQAAHARRQVAPDEQVVVISHLERRLHPTDQQLRVRRLRKLLKPRPQLRIVASTMSPYIMDACEARDVWLMASTGCVARLVSHPDYPRFFELMRPGEWWASVGEEWILDRDLPFEPTRYAHTLGAATRAPAVAHVDGTLETVSTHTVALQLTCWQLLHDLEGGLDLDLGLVLRFALIHDLPEALTGDEDTFGFTDEERAAKAQREAAALKQTLSDLPFLAHRLGQYERQSSVEAVFVRCVDKMLPKINRALARRRLTSQAEVSWCYAQMDRETSPLTGCRIYEPLRQVWLDLLDAIRPV